MYSNDPVGYCMGRTLEQKMMFGSAPDSGIDSKPCQAYMAQRCATNWDGICEAIYQQADDPWPGTLPRAATFGRAGSSQATAGDQMLALTAREKYRVAMLNVDGINCVHLSEPFDYTRPDSPTISYYSGQCIPEYRVDPPTADGDPVLNRLLDRPELAPDVLQNLYNTAKRKGTLDEYEGTRLGAFFRRMASGF